MEEIKKLTRDLIAKKLKSLGFKFEELNSRMSYGLIGNIRATNGWYILVYDSCFYVHGYEISINKDLLNLIQEIQKEYKELTRNEKNEIILTHN